MQEKSKLAIMSDDELQEKLTTPRQRIAARREALVEKMKSLWHKNMSIQETIEYMAIRNEVLALEKEEAATPTADENPTEFMLIVDMMDILRLIRRNDNEGDYEIWEQKQRWAITPSKYLPSETHAVTARFQWAKKALAFCEKFDSEHEAFIYLKNRVQVELPNLYGKFFKEKGE